MITETKLLEMLKDISLPHEEWSLIYHDRYAVSSRGRVMSLYFKNVLRFKELAQQEYCGYFKVHIHFGDFNKTTSVHRLVAIAFIDNQDNLPEVNHKDGNKLNNHVENLEWVTKSQNKRHSIDVLKRPHSQLGKRLEESNKATKVVQCDLNDNVIAEFHSIRVASVETGVEESTISRCVNGKRKTAGGFFWKLAD